ncbi:mycofactocin biosynthesis glycosyltransferase MftF [Saccharopolyspora griseoalba]|uniref:Mycofactocin biosynthesis glycosyltransferase MftF n=1 Tax=Saccharopolyspora griseoalba TaxID=1431848 RepID=A0ABW2LKK0_9PSEU
MITHLEADPGLQRWDGGRTLAGGSPFRVLRLSPKGSELVDRWIGGEPVTTGRSLARRLVRAGVMHPRHDRAPFGPEDVTAVIPVHGARPTALLAALEGLRVVLVDDGSSEPIPGAVRHDVKRGPGAARNTGWRAVTTPLVAFLDADTAPQPGWLEPLLEHFADPEVAAAAPRIRSVAGDSALARYESARSPLDLGIQPGPVRPGARISYVPTAALVVRAETLDELGGFDESMRFGEDVDLIWRLVENHQARYEPAAVVEHRPRGSWPALLRQRFGYGSSAGPLGSRHGERVAPVRMSLWSLLTWILVVLGRTRLAALVTGAAAVLLARKLDRVGAPVSASLKLAVRGNLGAAGLLLETAGRAWAPLVVPPLLATRRGRRALALVAARHLLDWRRTRPPLDPLRYALAAIADDLAYGCGVLRGALREGDRAALLPVLTDLGGRSSVPVGERE